MTKVNYSLFGEFAEYVTAGIISMIGVALFILADTYFIANGIGPTAIASLNVAIPISNILHGTGWLIGVGGATIYSIKRGKADHHAANSIFTFTIKLAAVVAVILCTLLYIFNRPILKLFGASAQTFDMAQDYYLIHAFFGPFFILSNTFISFVRNDYNPRLATVAMLLGGFSNIVLDYIFIYIFNWGMAGASFATIISPLVTMIVLTLHLKSPKRHLQFTEYRFNWANLIRILKIGFSSFFNELSTAIVIVIFNFTMLRMVGDIGVASYGIVANINIIAILIFQGMGQGVQPLVSRFHGMADRLSVKRLMQYATASVVAVSLSLMAITIGFSDTIVGLFNKTDHTHMQALAEQGLYFFSASFMGSGINIMCLFLMAAVDRSKASMAISLSRGLILIPPVIMIMSLSFGLTGVWSTMVVVEGLTALMSLIFLGKYYYKLTSLNN